MIDAGGTIEYMEEKLKITSGLLTLMLLLGIADVALVEGLPKASDQVAQVPTTNNQQPTTSPTPSKPKPPVATPPSTQPPVGGVRKSQGPDVLESLINNQFTFTDSREKMILQKVIPQGETILNTKVLLLNGDRAGSIAWVSSPNVKKYYLVLKEALHSAFTPDVSDLLDETQRREGHPTRNLLTFLDPGLSQERVVFIRVRERLYEFRVAEGASEAIFDLIEDLTK